MPKPAPRAPDSAKASGDEDSHSMADDAPDMDERRMSRHDSSLSKLTTKFQDLVRSCDGVMDLNVAADSLGVRIFFNWRIFFQVHITDLNFR